MLQWIHPPTSLHPFPSSFVLGPRRLYVDGSFLGVTSSLFATSANFSVIVSKFPHLKTFASLMFHTSSTLFAAFRLVDLFHSTATSRVSLQGFHPHLRSIKLVTLSLTLSSFIRTRLKAVAHFLQLARPRPQGFLPSVNLYSPRLAVSHTSEPIPSWFFLLQVFTRNSVPVPSHFLPPCTLLRNRHCHLRRWSLATAASIGWFLPKLPTCSRFCAYSLPDLATV